MCTALTICSCTDCILVSTAEGCMQVDGWHISAKMDDHITGGRLNQHCWMKSIHVACAPAHHWHLFSGSARLQPPLALHYISRIITTNMLQCYSVNVLLQGCHTRQIRCVSDSQKFRFMVCMRKILTHSAMRGWICDGPAGGAVTAVQPEKGCIYVGCCLLHSGLLWKQL